MDNVKPAAVAGQFYPADPAVLQNTVNELLEKAKSDPIIPKALIVPHAGFQYSGQIAANAYAGLESIADQVKRVVMLGPTHKVAVPGFAIPSQEFFATPLGNVELDQELLNSMRQFKKVWLADKSFEKEHCLEVQLPFLQTLFKDFKLVPILVGQATPEEVGSLIAYLWGGPETLIVISSDLSHYMPYEKAYQIDLATHEAIVGLHEERIGNQQACGRLAMRGLIYAAKKFGLCVRGLDLRNSGDTATNKDRVVGYGAYHFYEPAEQELLYSMQQKQWLLQLARESIQFYFKNGKPGQVSGDDLPIGAKQNLSTFVKVSVDGKMRGCKGSLQATMPLYNDVARNACMAAFKDPRFKPITEEEFKRLHIDIYILSPFEEIQFTDQADLLAKLRPGIDGVVLVEGKHSGTYLPSVWQQIPNSKKFLESLLVKMGLKADYWSDNFKAFRFIVVDQMDDELVA